MPQSQPVPRSSPDDGVIASPSPTESLSPTETVKIPARIVGLSRTEISGYFGKPQFRRRDAPAEIWQYRSTSCILDLFLYDSGKGLRVHHFEIRHPDTKPVSRRTCLAALVKARGADLSG